MKTYDVAIIGAGPAGLTAALYCGRARLKTFILEEKGPGGELLNTARIEDYPEFEEVSGQELAKQMLGVELEEAYVDGPASD